MSWRFQSLIETLITWPQLFFLDFNWTCFNQWMNVCFILILWVCWIEFDRLAFIIKMSIAKYKQDKYRILTVMKVETDIITSFTMNLTRQAVILVTCIMYVEIFITHYCFYRQRHNAFEVTLTDNYQYQLICWFWQYQRKNVKITDKEYL